MMELRLENPVPHVRRERTHRPPKSSRVARVRRVDRREDSIAEDVGREMN